MNPRELLRLVDTLHREKGIDNEVVFQGIEAALLSAARKHLGASENVVITINRETGEITALDDGLTIDPADLGRIAAQTAKQVMIQKIREGERDAISKDFAERLETVVAGTVQRFEGPNIVVSLPRTEGFLPKSEQIFNETYHVGNRIRALVLEVRGVGARVRVVLSRTHPEFVRKLFELEVPEVTEHVVEIHGIAREAGSRTKIAVQSKDSRVDAVGACVGVQGARIQSIRDELNGEKIDIVPWSSDPEVFITNALRPAQIQDLELDESRQRVVVTVAEDQLSLAIGKRGQNVRLAAKLTGWDIDIQSAEGPRGAATAPESASPSVASAPVPAPVPAPPAAAEKAAPPDETASSAPAPVSAPLPSEAAPDGVAPVASGSEAVASEEPVG